MVIMGFRGTVKNGVIVLEPGAKLPEGQSVEVIELPADASAASGIPGFGLWKDRGEFTDAAEASRQLRRDIENRSR